MPGDKSPWCVSSAELTACFLKEDRTPSALSALSHSFPSDSVYLCFFMNQLSLSSLFHFLFQSNIRVADGQATWRNVIVSSSALFSLVTTLAKLNVSE